MQTSDQSGVCAAEREPEALGIPLLGEQPSAALIRFTVAGPPVGKGRARVFVDKRDGKIRAATPKETMAFEKTVASFASVAAMPYYRGGSGLWSKDERYSLSIRVCWEDRRRRDIDNVLKAVADACNGVLWRDDSQVHHMSVTRVFDGVPRTEVVVEVLP